jgi:hypothetical protein
MPTYVRVADLQAGPESCEHPFVRAMLVCRMREAGIAVALWDQGIEVLEQAIQADALPRCDSHGEFIHDVGRAAMIAWQASTDR